MGARTTLTVVLAGCLGLSACGEPEPVGVAPVPPERSAPTTSTDGGIGDGSSPPPPTSPMTGTGVTTRAEAPTPEAIPALFDTEAEIREDLMSVAPSTAAPGATVELGFPAETDRGVAFTLDEALADTWATRFWLQSDGNGRPAWAPYGTAGWGWEDIGIGGPGPDRVPIPDSAAPGEYRLCTANASSNFCARLTVTTDVHPATAASIASIVSVAEDVAFYPACGTETLTFEGTIWYIIGWADSGAVDEMFAAQWDAISSREREPSHVFGPSGFVRVVEPGPGDDIGSLVIWDDGVARWQSDSGDLDVWLVTDEMRPPWEC